MTTKPDYARIAADELDIWGEVLTPEAQLHVLADERPDILLDSAVRIAMAWLLFGHGDMFAGSRFAVAGRVAFLSVSGFLAMWIVLMVAGIVPWSS